MKQYLDYARHVLEFGAEKEDRTGTGTLSTFGYQMRFNLQEGFPLLTTKRVPFKLIVSELLWFLNGDTNLRYLIENKNHIWDEWGFKKWVESDEYFGPDMTNFGIRSEQDEDFNSVYKNQLKKFRERILKDDIFAEHFGELGSIYGKQWRSWSAFDETENLEGQDPKIITIDQIENVVNELKTNPNSRRLIVSAWNVADVVHNKMALPPCHVLFQFYTVDNKLSCQLYQRSQDIFLGGAFNIASYALLTSMVAQVCNLIPYEFIMTVGDAHIYKNHVSQIKTQLTRKPRKLPELLLNPEVKNIFDFKMEDIKVLNYDPHPKIKGKVSV